MTLVIATFASYVLWSTWLVARTLRDQHPGAAEVWGEDLRPGADLGLGIGEAVLQLRPYPPVPPNPYRH